MHQRRRRLIDTGRNPWGRLIDTRIIRPRRLVRRWARLVWMVFLGWNKDRGIRGGNVVVYAAGRCFAVRMSFSLGASDVSRRAAAYFRGRSRLRRRVGALCDFSVQRVGIGLGAFGLHPNLYESLKVSVSAIVVVDFVIDLFPASLAFRNAEGSQLRLFTAKSHNKINR